MFRCSGRLLSAISFVALITCTPSSSVFAEAEDVCDVQTDVIDSAVPKFVAKGKVKDRKSSFSISNISKKVEALFAGTLCCLASYFCLFGRNIKSDESSRAGDKKMPEVGISPIESNRLLEIKDRKNIKKACEDSNREFGYWYYPSTCKSYENPIQFANARGFDCQNCKENVIFAGASPWYEWNGRAFVASEIGRELGVGYEVNLECDKDGRGRYNAKHIDFTNIAKSRKDDHFLKLRANGDYIAIAMPGERDDVDYGKSIVVALKGMINYWGKNGQNKPVYIHCTEGRFRTGDLLSILYILAGEDIESVREKFLKSASNYFGKEVAKRNGYDVEAFNIFIKSVGRFGIGDENALFNAKTVNDRIDIVRKYLTNNGMEEERIEELILFIKKL